MLLAESLLLGLVVILAADPLSSQTPIGGEFQVNTYTTGYQGGFGSSYYDAQQDVGMAASVGFVVVWQDIGEVFSRDGQDGSVGGIFGQRYDVSGTPLSSEFQVNTLTTGNQSSPAIAMDDSGDFVVVWSSFRSEAAEYYFEIFGQSFDSQGVASGTEFTVASAQLGYLPFPHTPLASPDIAMSDDSSFIVAWQSATSTEASDIWAQRYTDTAVPDGASFRVNSNTDGYQASPRVAVDSSGNFVIVWQDGPTRPGPEPGGGDGSFTSIEGQRFTSDGDAIGAQFRVNSYTTGLQLTPAVGAASDGGFVVSWIDYPYYDVYGPEGRKSLTALRYSPGGNPLGAEFRVPSAPAYYDGAIKVQDLAVEPDGNFIVVWNAFYSTGNDSDTSIQTRSFGADGVAWGPDLQVNSYTLGPQLRPAVAGRASDSFVVVWDEGGRYIDSQDGDLSGVFGQLFGSDLIFTDGFESGDLSTWSAFSP